MKEISKRIKILKVYNALISSGSTIRQNGKGLCTLGSKYTICGTIYGGKYCNEKGICKKMYEKYRE